MSDIQTRLEEEIRTALVPRLAAAKTRQEKTRETAALLFFSHGIYPSAKLVHSYTRHGSMTDINNDLREFWADLREKSRVKIEAPMLPAEVVSLFSDGLAKLWDHAMEKAHAALDGERQQAAEEVAKAQLEATEAERLRRIADAHAEEMAQEVRDERERREVAERNVAAMAAELEELQSSLAKWHAQAESESTARREAEERFSRDLEAERAARKRDAEMLEGEMRFAKMQIEAARGAERELRERIKEDKANKDAEINAYRQRANLTEEALNKARMELAEVKGRYEAMKALKALTKTRTRSAPAAAPRPLKKRTSLRR